MRKSWSEKAIAAPEGFLTAAEYAKLKDVSTQAVAKSCRAGKHPGAFQDQQSGRWYVPVSEEAKQSFIEAAPRRKNRPLKATDKEWQEIVEMAATTKYSVNEYIIRKALNKKV